MDPTGRRILLTEDVEINRRLISLILSSEAEIDEAETGEQALLFFGARRYDLVLMDLRLPGLAGLDVIRLMRGFEDAGRRTPIIAITADVLPGTLAQARAAGIDGYIPKPFTTQALRLEVGRWLHGDAPAALVPTPATVELSDRFGQKVVNHLLGLLDAQLGEFQAPADVATLVRRVHALKGAAGSLGFDGVARSCSDLELALKNGDPAEARLERAVRACAQARSSIAQTLACAA